MLRRNVGEPTICFPKGRRYCWCACSHPDLQDFVVLLRSLKKISPLSCHPYLRLLLRMLCCWWLLCPLDGLFRIAGRHLWLHQSPCLSCSLLCLQALAVCLAPSRYSVHIYWVNECMREGKRKGLDWMNALCVSSTLVGMFQVLRSLSPTASMLPSWIFTSLSNFLSLSVATLPWHHSFLVFLLPLTAFVPLLCLLMLTCSSTWF